MKKTIKLKSVSDPSHGWIKVSSKIVWLLGLKISDYSYISPSGTYFYLEEDCDAPKLFRALDENKLSYIMTQSYSDKPSYVRNYDRFVRLEYFAHDCNGFFKGNFKTIQEAKNAAGIDGSVSCKA